MVQFIEKHRRLLRAYCLIARIVGWFLILGGVSWVALVRRNMVGSIAEQDPDFMLYIVSSFVYDFFIPGFLAFAIAGLLDYLLRPHIKPPLILGMTDKLCYIYAGFLIIKLLNTIGFIKSLSDNSWIVDFRYLTIPELSEHARILLVQPILGPTLAKVLLLIGVGMILHRLLPVIEESKTLV
jgi:hypothetical protein